MEFTDKALTKTNLRYKNSSDEILDTIGRKLPKKLRKKLHWKKIAPILSVLITMFSYFTRTRFHQPETSTKTSVAQQPTSKSSQLRQPVMPKKCEDNALRAYVAQAEAYQIEIDRLVQDTTSGNDQSRVREVATHVQAWTNAITHLAQRVDSFRQNQLINNDLKAVPKSIATLESRLRRETNPMLKTELERTLANRQQQLEMLEKLQQNTYLAEVKIENTLSLLGTMYSQILTGQSTQDVANYRRLLNDIDEEVYILRDHLEALEEVKLAPSQAH